MLLLPMPESKTKKFVAEYKQKKFLDTLYKKNTIEFDKYFKDSRRIEKGKRFKLINTKI